MRIGFVSAVFGDLSLEEVFSAAVECDADCVELMCWPPGPPDRRYAGVTHLDVAHRTDENVARVQRLVAETGVSISGLGYYPNPLSPNAEESALVVEHLRHVLRAAARLGVPVVNTFLGRDPWKTVDDNWPRVLEVWRPLLHLAEDLGVRIAIENCPMLYSRDEWPGGKNLATCPAIWRRMFADLNSRNLGLNFDPSHFVWQQMDYVGVLAEFGDRLFHVHAKDTRLDRTVLSDRSYFTEQKDYQIPKLPGLGDIDWSRFCAALGETRYDGPVCVEVEDRAYEGALENRKRGVAQGVRYLRNFL